MNASELNPETLAKAFSAVLASWLTGEEQYQVIALNNIEPNAGVCHSHDFCDANMAMAEAFEKFGIDIDKVLDDAQAVGGGEYLTLWEKAWEIAKRNGFWFAKGGGQ